MKLRLFCISAFLLLVKAQRPGSITNFKQKSHTKETITLEWTYTPGDLKFKVNYIEQDGGLPLPNHCHGSSVVACEQQIVYLDACTAYNFTITPVFEDSIDPTNEISGIPASTIGQTDDALPSNPLNIQVNESLYGDTTIQWDAPETHPECVASYRLCIKLETERENCQEVFGTSIVQKLESCVSYKITVAATTPGGTVGPVEEIYHDTNDGVPGIVMNMEVVAVGIDFINVTFERPIGNPYCVDGYTYNIEPLVGSEDFPFNLRNPIAVSPNRQTCDPCYASFAPLTACTNFTITINAYNIEKDAGPTSERTAATDESEPKEPSYLIAETEDIDSILAKWEGNQNDPCAVDAEICWVDEMHPDESCQIVEDGGRGGQMTITDLLPCTLYTVNVVFLSPDGIPSIPVVNKTYTNDVEPNPVGNLTILEITETTVKYFFTYPEEQEQCVFDHEIFVHDLNEGETFHSWSSPMESQSESNELGDPISKTETEEGLNACSDYLISVRTLSRQHLMSSWENATFSTEEAVPGKPRNPKEKYVDETSIIFVYYQPLENPTCATSYKITWTSAGGGTRETFFIPEHPFPFQMEEHLKDLTPCTEYTITITAEGDTTGESVPSDPLVSTTLGCSS